MSRQPSPATAGAADPGEDGPTPSATKMVIRALRRRCPVCDTKGISRHVAHVLPACPTCGLNMERQVGSFIGGIGINTIVSFVALFTVIVGGFIATGGEASVGKILVPALAIALVVPLVFYARSRLVWVALELIWFPLDRDETSVVAI